MKACKSDCDSDALILSQAAQIVRRNMFNGSYCFEGVFDNECQKTAVPPLLSGLVRMILEGPSIDLQSTFDNSCMSIVLSTCAFGSLR